MKFTIEIDEDLAYGIISMFTDAMYSPIDNLLDGQHDAYKQVEIRIKIKSLIEEIIKCFPSVIGIDEGLITYMLSQYCIGGGGNEL